MLERAITISRKRHQCLLEEDFEAFQAAGHELEATCRAMELETLGDAYRGQLDELIALETSSMRLLETALGTTSLRMASLGVTGRANRAYQRHEQFSVNAG